MKYHSLVRKGFFRKIAFGIGLNENIPSDPLNWAQSQFNEIPDIDLMGAPTLSEQIKLRSKMRETEDKLTVKFKHSAVEYEEARQKNWRKYGTDFYQSLELHIRHKSAISSSQPAFERMFHFWTNHFAVIDANGLKEHTIGPYQREVIRKNLTGSFANLVKQATIGFAMLESLDNGDSIGPNSSYVRKEKAGGYYKGDTALNENHARELLELHTISPDAGYTQEDVIELSKVMTGWKTKYYKNDYVDWKNPVIFDSYYHEPKEKKILGKIYNSKDAPINSKDQLFAVIDDLCAREDCRKFISTKLCKYFIDDDPPSEIIEYVMNAWKKSDGDLPTIHKAVVEMDFRNPEYNKKYLMPETWWLQVTKMMDLNFLLSEESFWKHDFESWPRAQFQITELMEDLGHHPFDFKQPNGYIDTEEEWISPEMMIRRLVYAKHVYNYIKSENTKNDVFEGYLTSIIDKNFDNADEITKDLFKDNNIKSNQITTFLNRPEVLRV